MFIYYGSVQYAHDHVAGCSTVVKYLSVFAMCVLSLLDNIAVI